MWCLEQVSTRTLFALSFVTTLACIGCGAKSDRLPISGTVTLDGKPLDGGTIRFTSVGSGKLIATGAAINDGEFQIPQAKGLPPGTYGLEVSAADPVVPPGATTAPERIPAEYNVNSQHKIDVTDEGANHFEFAIATTAR